VEKDTDSDLPQGFDAVAGMNSVKEMLSEEVMNECTSFMKVTKLQLEKEYVSVVCELFVSEASDLEDIVKRCIVTLHQTKERFEKEMKGL
jgi:hypothetical protein